MLTESVVDPFTVYDGERHTPGDHIIGVTYRVYQRGGYSLGGVAYTIPRVIKSGAFVGFENNYHPGGYR